MVLHAALGFRNGDGVLPVGGEHVLAVRPHADILVLAGNLHRAARLVNDFLQGHGFIADFIQSNLFRNIRAGIKRVKIWIRC